MVKEHVLRRIGAAPVLREPFPHCIVDGVFPAEFYEDILEHWPEEESWRPIGETGRVKGASSAQRMVIRAAEDLGRLGAGAAFWRALASWLGEDAFRAAILQKFGEELSANGFGADLRATAAEILLISDRTDYAIGPHTDHPQRVASLLFYLPEDDTFRRFGTRFYAPLDPAFRCRGGPHYGFAKFRLAASADFVPNRLVMFPKSDRCFHGVEPVDLPGIDRRLLIYNLRRVTASPAAP